MSDNLFVWHLFLKNKIYIHICIKITYKKINMNKNFLLRNVIYIPMTAIKKHI